MTRSAWACLTVGLALLVLGYALGYPELLALGVAAVVLLGFSALLVVGKPRARLERRIAPLRVTRGEPSTGTLVVENLSGTKRLRVDAFDPVAGGPVRTDVRVAVPTVPRSGRREVTYELPTDRRAVLDVGPVRWERSDPFGFWKRQQEMGRVERLFVHPKVHIVQIAASGRARHVDGPTSDSAPRGTITFHALREYVRGDDMRHVHWKSSARLGTLMVKENVDTALPSTTVLFDTRAMLYDSPARFEEAVDLVASIVTAAARAQFPFRLLTSDGVQMESGGGADQTRGVLDLLAGVRPHEPDDGKGGLVDLADSVDHRRTSSNVVAVAGLLDETRDATDLSALRSVARRYDRAVLVRMVPSGTSPLGLGDDVVVLDAHGAAEAALAWNVWARR
ncbi:MAG TPA: DUF58 domain-containing protein [Actinomycetales bacterium]|nr:DUF58 domain-containing protein [Actinomycetales bacterium]